MSILGPKLLRPYGNYKVSIAGGSRAHNLYVAVEGKKSTGEQFSQGRVVQVPPAATRLVELEVNTVDFFTLITDVIEVVKGVQV